MVNLCTQTSSQRCFIRSFTLALTPVGRGCYAKCQIANVFTEIHGRGAVRAPGCFFKDPSTDSGGDGDQTWNLLFTIQPAQPPTSLCLVLKLLKDS